MTPPLDAILIQVGALRCPGRMQGGERCGRAHGQVRVPFVAWPLPTARTPAPDATLVHLCRRCAHHIASAPADRVPWASKAREHAFPDTVRAYRA